MSGRLLLSLAVLFALCAVSDSFACWFLNAMVCPVLCFNYAVNRCMHDTCYCAYPIRNEGFY